MSSHPVTCWLFGKLPSHGDFVSRGIRPDMRERLDQWLSAEMAQAADRFGDMFGERFDTAPAWLFAQDYGAGAEAGAVCPSVDSAGRRFPLIVSRQVADGAQPGATALACIDSVYQAFAAGMDADTLWVTVGAAQVIQESDAPDSGWWMDGATLADASLVDRWPTGLLCRMLEPVQT